MFAERRAGPVGDALINLDPVEFVGHIEALEAGGKAGDRLRVLEGVQGEGAGLFPVLVVDVAEAPAEVGHRLHAELAIHEVGEDAYRLRWSGSASNSTAWVKHPAPAFAVALGGCIALGHLVEDGIAIVIDRGAVVIAVAVPVIAFLVVGELAQVGEILQPPGVGITGAAEQAGSRTGGGSRRGRPCRLPWWCIRGLAA